MTDASVLEALLNAEIEEKYLKKGCVIEMIFSSCMFLRYDKTMDELRSRFKKNGWTIIFQIIQNTEEGECVRVTIS